MKVLVTNANRKNALGAVRSLANSYNVSAIDNNKLHISYLSRYCEKNFYNYTDPKISIVKFIKDLLNVVKTYNYDLILPIGIDTTIPISYYKKYFEEYCKVPIADYDTIIKAHDKKICLNLADKYGIPIPDTYSPTNKKDLIKISKNIKYPVVIKLRKGSATQGLQYVKSSSELIKKYYSPIIRSDMIIDYSFPLIQEYIKGDIYDICILFNKGKYITSLAQKRVLTNPPKGGSGLANITVQYPELIKMSINFLKKIKWHGVAQVEYKLDENDQPRLMEINPKFWGTLELSIAAGINFPKLLCDLAIYDEIPKNIDYLKDCKYLWLVPSLINYISQGQSKMESFKNILKFVDGKTQTNIRWDDPVPSLYALLLMLKRGISLATS